MNIITENILKNNSKQHFYSLFLLNSISIVEFVKKPSQITPIM